MEEYYNKQEVIEYLIINMGWHDEDGYSVDDAEEKRQIITDLLNGLPLADVRPVVTAYWEKYEFMGEEAYRCSNCKSMALPDWSLDGSYYLEGNYCDFCGAYMCPKEELDKGRAK